MGQLFRNISRQLTDMYERGEAQVIAFMLLEWAAKLDRAQVLAGDDDNIAQNILTQITNSLCRLNQGEPIQYVMGQTEFCGLTIHVGPDVLIPRPETEMLVDIVSSYHPQTILDIGTGSGCIALALKHRMPDSVVTATDISTQALDVARANAKRLNLDIKLKKEDILHATPNGQKWDAIVSNPPYICNKEMTEMDTNVLKYEPHTALFVPDSQPLIFYQAITKYATQVLNNGGLLAYEANRQYTQQIQHLMQYAGFINTQVVNDQFDNPRIVTGQWRTPPQPDASIT